MNQNDQDITDEELLEALKTPITSGVGSSAGSEQLGQKLSAKGILDYRSSKNMIVLTEKLIVLTRWIIGLTVVLAILTFILVYKEFVM
jgi:hypothetical protein